MIRKIAVNVAILTLSLYSVASWSFPSSIDSDGDNIPDTLELFMGGDQSGTDSDFDGIPDVVEDNITNTDKNTFDGATCSGTAPATDLTGLWDVRISDDLTQPTDVTQDILTGVSICHTVENGLKIFHAEAGYATGVSFSGGNLSFTLGGGDAVISTAPYAAGGGAFAKGRIDDTTAEFDGGSKEFRLDRRTTKTEWATNFTEANGEGVYGTQEIALTDAMGWVPVDSPLNPASAGVEIRIDDTIGTHALVYVAGGVLGGYVIPSTGSFVVVARVPNETGLELDGDMLGNDQLIEDIEVYTLITELPATGEGGMLRGIADSTEYEDHDSDFTTDVFVEAFDVDLYIKAKGPITEHRTFHSETSTGSKIVSRLLLYNPYLSADTVTISGGNITGGSNTFVDNTDGSDTNDTESQMVVANRVSPHRDGEKVGAADNGNDIKTNFLFFKSEGNVTSGQTFSNGAYTFSFTGPDLASPADDETVSFVDYSSTPMDIVQNLRINGIGLPNVIHSGRLINATLSHDITWNEVTTGGVGNDGAGSYQLRIENADLNDVANDDVGDADRLFETVTSAACSAGSCSATLDGGTFDAGEIFTIRGIGIDDDAGENRSITTKRFIIAGDSSTCSINSDESGNITNGAACGEYYELASNRRTYDNTGGGGSNNDNVFLNYALYRPSTTPKAIVVVIPGGGGFGGFAGETAGNTLYQTGPNSQTRSAQMYADAGYLVISTNRPSDKITSSGATYSDYRTSALHAYDLASIINEVKAAESLPNIDVMLAGTSWGGVSVVSQYALGTGIAMSVPVNTNADSDGNPGNGIQPPSGTPVGDCTPGPGIACPENVTVPVHYLVHEDELCLNTIPSSLVGEQDMFNRFSNVDTGIYGVSPNTFDKVLSGQGITPLGGVCKSLHDHGFIGVESQMVTFTTAFMDGVLATLGSNSAPEVDVDSISSAIAGSARTIDLSALAKDMDGDSLSFELPFTSSNRGGTLSLSGSVVTYTAPATVDITDGIVYVAVDGNGGRTAGVLPIYLSADTDSDGIADVYENTLVGGLGFFNATGDFDTDGFTDLEEYLANTDANDINDNPGKLAFIGPTFTAPESNNTQSISVARSGGTNGTVSVECTVSDGTASSAIDYHAVAVQTLVWVDGESGIKTCDVTLVDDDDTESTETINFSLGNPTGNAKLGTQDTAVFNIEDNDPNVLVAAALPSSRSVQVGNPATAFATIINTGGTTATGCSITPVTSVAADFLYQTTNPATNALTGSPNTPVDIAAGAFQTYLFAFTPTSAISPTDIELSYDCSNTAPAPTTVGVNTLLLSASSSPIPDIVALAATPTADGIVNIPGDTGANAFVVATVNVGATGSITASADTGGATLPVTLFICETNPATSVCLDTPAASVTTTINGGATPTFAIFVNGSGTVPFDPANNRIFVRFKDGGDVTRGSTSVAVRTQ